MAASHCGRRSEPLLLDLTPMAASTRSSLLETITSVREVPTHKLVFIAVPAFMVTNWVANNSRLHAPLRPPAPGPPKIFAGLVSGRRLVRTFWRMIGPRAEAQCVCRSLSRDRLAALR